MYIQLAINHYKFGICHIYYVLYYKSINQLPIYMFI